MKRAKTAQCIVSTGESALYGNLILKKVFLAQKTKARCLKCIQPARTKFVDGRGVGRNSSL